MPSRAAARRAIIEGRVQVAGIPVTRPAAPVAEDASVAVDPEATRYVGRGGHKLAAALDAFGIGVAGRRAVDIGASTGGFTDCLLQRGAIEVVALDVGSGQLHASLRRDPRVVDLEGTDVRTAEARSIGAPFDVVVADVSFISLRLIADAVARLAGDPSDIVLLVKPQFEAGPGHRSKRGVVADEEVQTEACREVARAYAVEGFAERGLMASPIPGRAGNREFLLWLDRGRSGAGSAGTAEDDAP